MVNQTTARATSEAYTSQPQSNSVTSASETTKAFQLLALRTTPDWSGDCTKHIEELRNLPENWDSYGAKIVNRHSILWAIEIVRTLSKVVGVNCPQISASATGFVSLSWEWNNGETDLDVAVLPDGRLIYSYTNELAPNRDEEGTAHIDRIATILTRW